MTLRPSPGKRGRCSTHRPPPSLLDPVLPRPRDPRTTNRTLPQKTGISWMPQKSWCKQRLATTQNNPESNSSSNSESTKSNNSTARELKRRWTQNESPDDIRDFTPQPDRPRLPSGEWYMPDLNNTSLSTVMEYGSRMESGRYLFQFS